MVARVFDVSQIIVEHCFFHIVIFREFNAIETRVGVESARAKFKPLQSFYLQDIPRPKKLI